MFKADKRLRNRYDKFNRDWWDGRLPDAVMVGWDDAQHDQHQLGQTLSVEENGSRMFIISISHRLKDFPIVASLTLIHEMCHVALYPYMKHGKRFREELLRVLLRGAVDYC